MLIIKTTQKKVNDQQWLVACNTEHIPIFPNDLWYVLRLIRALKSSYTSNHDI